MRAMIFYFIMQFFKGKQNSPGMHINSDCLHMMSTILVGAETPGGVSKPMRGPATNMFQDGMGFDMYVYVSEQEIFGEFDVSKYCREIILTHSILADPRQVGLEEGGAELRKLGAGTYDGLHI